MVVALEDQGFGKNLPKDFRTRRWMDDWLAVRLPLLGLEVRVKYVRSCRKRGEKEEPGKGDGRWRGAVHRY